MSVTAVDDSSVQAGVAARQCDEVGVSRETPRIANESMCTGDHRPARPPLVASRRSAASWSRREARAVDCVPGLGDVSPAVDADMFSATVFTRERSSPGGSRLICAIAARRSGASPTLAPGLGMRPDFMPRPPLSATTAAAPSLDSRARSDQRRDDAQNLTPPVPSFPAAARKSTSDPSFLGS